MISAFGVVHKGVLKDPTGLPQMALRGTKKVSGRLVPRGKLKPKQPVSKAKREPRPKYVPTPEQLEAQRARKALQQEAKANRRSGVGSKLKFSTHWKAMGDVPAKTAGAALVTGGALYALNRDKIAKAEKKDVALGATAGAAGTYAASNVVGQSAKITLKERRARRGTSPREEKIWAEHTEKHGKGQKAFAKYPKELPDWRGQRALAFKNNPKVAAGIMVAGTAAGAAYGAKR